MPKRRLGDIVRIDLGDGFHAYARVLEEAIFAFYSIRSKEEVAAEEVIRERVVFQVPVMRHAVTRGRWKVIGNIPLEENLKSPRPRFMQDILSPENFSIYEKGAIRPATREECVGLEMEAIWEPTHVEDRLRDHFAGRENKWVRSLKMR